MQSEYSSNHPTEINRINRIDEGGWECVCRRCGYRALYTIDKQGKNKLEILFAGDPTARHTSGMELESAAEGQADPEQTAPDFWDPLENGFAGLIDPSQVPPDDEGLNQDEGLSEGDGLPFEIQAQVLAILHRYE